MLWVSTLTERVFDKIISMRQGRRRMIAAVGVAGAIVAGVHYYTVQPGDTLSGIAARTCGNGSAWQGIYAQNTAVVGSNPNLIFPGQQLRFTCRGGQVVTTVADVDDAGKTRPAGNTAVVVPPAVPVVSGGMLANGTVIYKFLRNAGYRPVAAAGAIASMWGESLWNPEAWGTGGCGLMGWTPASSVANYGGSCLQGASYDLSTQLPAILRFVAANGDAAVVAEMDSAGSVTSAAYLWGQRVERYGISDVHWQGVAYAVQIAASVDGIRLAS